MANPIPNEPTSVNYTVKELLSEIKAEQSAGFGRLEAALATKADTALVSSLRVEVVSLGERLRAVEKEQQKVEIQDTAISSQRETQMTWVRWLLPTAITLVIAVATVVALWIHP